MVTHAALIEGVEQLGLSLSRAQLEQCQAYMNLIQKWNKAYNLVGTSDTQTLIEKHLLDSLAISPFIQQTPVLDVGSGAGLPGILLAIAHPEIEFTLCDSNGKKARFMRQSVIELGLKNVTVEHGRIQSYHAEQAPMIVMSRAFAPLQEALEILADVCHSRGQVMIMLGLKPSTLPTADTIKTIINHEIAVPGLESQRHLLVAKQQ
jgi:16S rRNA (guanine527-N7)-methyltransferase